MRRLLVPLLLILAVALYGFLAATRWADRVWSVKHGRDFASFYYALQAAADGDDPYLLSSLNERARADDTRKSCNPFFYPPPFLLVFAWCRPLSLETAFRAFYVADHLFLLAVLLALWRWVPSAPLAVALAWMAPTFSPIADNDWMGQVNLLVMAVTLAGLLSAERGWERTGGLLVGLGCMLKMSPGLLVAWWLWKRRLRPVFYACGAAVALSLASLPLVGWDLQVKFYTEVLPGFGEGAYHSLRIPIDLQANHSIPSLLHEVFPSGSATRLSGTATWISRLLSVLLLGALAWRIRRLGPDPLTRLLEVGAVVVLMLVLPVFAYEHHMVWLLVPYGALVAAGVDRRLGRTWMAVLGVAFAFQALPLAWLKEVYSHLSALGPARDWVYYPLREAKFVAALVAGVACAVAAGSVRARTGGSPGTLPGSETTSPAG